MSAAARPCARSTCTATVPSAMRPSCRGDAGEMWGDPREMYTGDAREIYGRCTGDLYRRYTGDIREIHATPPSCLTPSEVHAAVMARRARPHLCAPPG